VIVDLARFREREEPFWRELETELDALDRDTAHALTLEKGLRLHYLYRRAASGLIQVKSLPGEIDLRRHLESLTARAFAEIHDTRRYSAVRRLRDWITHIIPRTFRAQRRAFAVSLGITLLGALFGGGVVAFDYETKAVLLPFPHLMGDPSDRVAFEESRAEDRMQGAKTTFSAMLMVNNIRVSIAAMALGMTFGVGTAIMLFYNGVILGAVVYDYVQAGEGVFLTGWLLPHGSVEIPSILLAGQAGFVLASALIGWGDSRNLRTRLRAVRTDVVTLVFCVAMLLVWAGIIEAFMSQYHEPVLPYWLKIAFGGVQLTLLAWYLGRAGRSPTGTTPPNGATP